MPCKCHDCLTRGDETSLSETCNVWMLLNGAILTSGPTPAPPTAQHSPWTTLYCVETEHSGKISVVISTKMADSSLLATDVKEDTSTVIIQSQHLQISLPTVKTIQKKCLY